MLNYKTNKHKVKTAIILTLAVSVIGIACKSSKKSNQTSLLNDNTFIITEISTDKTYGYTQENPIKVGGVKNSEGPQNEKRFLNALCGPNEEKISYYRLGSCCHFETKNGFMGGGLLDKYSVTWKGSQDTVVLYINMYDYGPLKAPVGFSIKKQTSIY